MCAEDPTLRGCSGYLRRGPVLCAHTPCRPGGATMVRQVEDHSEPLLESEAAGDPFEQFGRWYQEASRVMRLPEAMAVATAGGDARPSVRMVLMKQWDQRGFVFHTNYESRKGRELNENPLAALLFHWDPLGRQVRMEGPVERISSAESDEYFASRPYGAQISALASHQSQPVAGREVLDARAGRLRSELGGAPVGRPSWWGGYRLRPAVFEFWQNRDDRFHDRLQYSWTGTLWQIERLEP